MKVVSVSLQSTETAEKAHRFALTPELLAATGARYSRSNEGLEQIVSRIDPNHTERSVESIFRMIDYGHQSIADMAPVAIFIDGISMWLAFYVWSLCPTAGGQESSTRYIKLSEDGVVEPAALGLSESVLNDWRQFIRDSFSAYEKSLTFWQDIIIDFPEVARIPASITSDYSDKGQRIKARMRRNYGFDRARSFIPAATSTNMMMLMSARGWVQLSQVLLSHQLCEAKLLGAAIRDELALVTPRLIKHAEAKVSIEKGLRDEFRNLIARALRCPCPQLDDENADCVHPATPFIDTMFPPDINEQDLASSLDHHDNRYAWIGDAMKRTVVRFGWNAVSFAEIRDLNRHRTGNKHIPLVPLGFYYALDQLPSGVGPGVEEALRQSSKLGKHAAGRARELLMSGDPTFVYWLQLGTQFPFEHVTTADKFVYEAELRTGAGAHFRYAQHFHDLLSKWYQKIPGTKGLIIEGAAEPE